MTSALVVTLDEDAHYVCAAMNVLSADRRLTLGERIGARLPVVAETAGLAAAEVLAGDLLTVAGVLAVDVVLVDFDPDADVDAPPYLGRHRQGARAEEDGDGPP